MRGNVGGLSATDIREKDLIPEFLIPFTSPDIKEATDLPFFVTYFTANYNMNLSIRQFTTYFKNIISTTVFKERLLTIGLLYEYFSSHDDGNQGYLYRGNIWENNDEYMKAFYHVSGQDKKRWVDTITKIMEGYILHEDSKQYGVKKMMKPLPQWWNDRIETDRSTSLLREKEKRSTKERRL